MKTQLFDEVLTMQVYCYISAIKMGTIFLEMARNSRPTRSLPIRDGYMTPIEPRTVITLEI